MADRPILFSGAMVRALLAGTKTQTRRQIKPRGKRPSLFNGDWSDSYILDPGNESWRRQDIPIETGDRLWVKETYALVGDNLHLGDEAQSCFDMRTPVYYRADEEQPELSRWRPSIFMKRGYSRLTLTVTDVRVERLQDISRDDAVAEGLIQVHTAPALAAKLDSNWGFEGDKRHGSPRSAYAALWNHINGTGSWEANPWIVAYTFSVERGNIDQIGRDVA